jgi:hypothetical protein
MMSRLYSRNSPRRKPLKCHDHDIIIFLPPPSRQQHTERLKKMACFFI